jgi:hypothetical protein
VLSHERRIVVPVVGALAAVVGGVGTVALFVSGDGRSWGLPGLLGPPLGLVGVLALGGALWGFARGWRIAVLAAGLLLLVIAVDPCLYTPALRHDRPEGEAAGMIGTLLFLFVGVPGVLVTGVGIGLVLSVRKVREATRSRDG